MEKVNDTKNQTQKMSKIKPATLPELDTTSDNMKTKIVEMNLKGMSGDYKYELEKNKPILPSLQNHESSIEKSELNLQHSVIFRVNI
jgi:tryptophanyl-tRNA synthetase